MSRILVCKDDEDLLLKKSRAFKYKEVDLTSIQCGNAFNIVDSEDKLTAVAEDINEAEEPIYSIVTDEFGLYAMSSGVSAKIKVSFCDNGKMIVDILEGAILIKPSNDILLASRGVTNLPNVQADGILWINADDILSFKQYWGSMKDKYIQDFEYVFTIKGEVVGGLKSMSIRIMQEEVIDTSGGKIAALEVQQRVKEEAKQAKNSFKDMISGSGSNYIFDEDEDEDDYEDGQADEDDFDDGSDY